MNKKILSVVLIMLVIAGTMISITGCNEANDVITDESTKPFVIRLEGGDWGLPSPYQHYPRGPGGYKMRLVFDSLLEKDENGLIPWLAESWTIENEGKAYVFKIRDGVLWHDGTPLTAEDVQFSFNYLINHPPVWNDLIIEGKSFIEKVEIINEDQIKIMVDEPNVTYLDRLGIARILPKHIWKNVGDSKELGFPEAVMGCGPYVLSDYSKEHGTYRFKAFENYWGPKPLAGVIEYIPASDSVLAFESKELDIISVSPDLLERYKQNREFSIKQNPGFWGYRLLLNMETRPELKDKNIRQALAYAIDQDELVEKVARGAAVPASAAYLPVDHIWHNKDVKKYSYDIEKSKNLLQGEQLTFELIVGNSKNEVRIAELLRINFEKAGIELNVKSVDMKTRDSVVKSGHYELALIGHGGWGRDADSLRKIYAVQKSTDQRPSSNAIPGFHNEQINALAEQQMIEMNPEKRKAIIFELQEVIAEELPIIPIYNTTSHVVYRPDQFDGWMYMYDHHSVTHSKLSYLERE